MKNQIEISALLKSWRVRESARIGRRVTQTDGARSFGVALTTYQRWENGRASPKGAGLAFVLAQTRKEE